MKKIFSIALFISAGFIANGQLVMQNGNYGLQRQKSYITIEGKLNNKYINKGLYWFCLSSGGIDYRISIVSLKKFKEVQVFGQITLDSCFKIQSNKWHKN